MDVCIFPKKQEIEKYVHKDWSSDILLSFPVLSFSFLHFFLSFPNITNFI